METLATQFVENLALGSTFQTHVPVGLRMEIVSVKGLALPLESREILQGLQVSALYRNKHFRSAIVSCTSTDPIINFISDFDVSKEELLTQDNIIMVYLSLAPIRTSDQVRCGINACCRTLGE